MSKRVIKSITLKIGNVDYKVVAAPSDVPLSTDKVDVTTLDDDFKNYLPSPQPERGVMAITIAAESAAQKPAIGVVLDYVFAVTYTDGTSAAATSETVTVNGFMNKVEAAKGETGANRHAVWDCEITPTGVVD